MCRHEYRLVFFFRGPSIPQALLYRLKCIHSFKQTALNPKPKKQGNVFREDALEP